MWFASCSSNTAEIAIIQSVTPTPILLKSFTVSCLYFTPFLSPLSSSLPLTSLSPSLPPFYLSHTLIRTLCTFLPTNTSITHVKGYLCLYVLRVRILYLKNIPAFRRLGGLSSLAYNQYIKGKKLVPLYVSIHGLLILVTFAMHNSVPCGQDCSPNY